jgi:hypothetical protein
MTLESAAPEVLVESAALAAIETAKSPQSTAQIFIELFME